MKNIFNKRGYTMVEILVVVAIIVVIGFSIMLALNSSRQAGRDAKRVTDMKNLQQALEQYKMDEGVYPEVITPGMPLTGTNLNITYMASVPSNPNPRDDGSCADEDYTYVQDESGASYHITFCLGGESSSLAGGQMAIPGGFVAVASCVPDCTGLCGGASDGCGGTCNDECVASYAVQALVVAGGGGGSSGGGGGGGVVYNSSLSLSAGQGYPVVVGAGGAGTMSNVAKGSNGSDSSFGGITAVGGGGGATNVTDLRDGASGGSGGGGAYTGVAGTWVGGTATQGDSGGGTGYGYAGGSNGGINVSYYPAGGGGGAGGVGQDAVSNTEAGDGGVGRANDIVGSTAGQNVGGIYYLAGGGGGATNTVSGFGAGGNGGGGDGASVGYGLTGTNGTANTGGGGGGGASASSGGSGGSGVVVISYPTASLPASTGGIITTSGENTIHTFTQDGAFCIGGNCTCSPSCGAGYACNSDGYCACVPNCGSNTCGDDGCGGSCGSCLGQSPAATCSNGSCVTDTQTVLLLHMDGADNGTTFTDSSSSGKALNARSGAVTKTAIKKFGTASGYFTSSSYLRYADSDDWYIDQDMTIDFWYYPTSVPAYNATPPTWWGQYQSSAEQMYFMNYSTQTTFWLPALRIKGGVKEEKGGYLTKSIMPINTWVHFAVVFSGLTVKVYVNGVLLNTAHTYSSEHNNLAGYFYVGKMTGAWWGTGITGYVDEFRVSKGVARWTSNFTPPTEAY